MSQKFSGEVIQLKGKKAGGTSMILVGVHGDETCGPQAMDFLLPNLKIEKGTVFIAYANPRAIIRGKRQAEQNLNRLFKPVEELSLAQIRSYEYQRALYLKTFLDRSDVLLDVHASSNEKSRRFIIAERNSDDITSLLPVETIVYGFDTVEPGGTDYYMNMNGKKGICVECGIIGTDEALDTAMDNIMTFFKVRGHISGEVTPLDQEHFEMYQLYMTKTDNFKLTKELPDFCELEKGQLIGMDGNVPVKANKKSMVLFAHDRKKAGEEGFLLGVKLD